MIAVRFKDLGLTRIRDEVGRFMRGTIRIGFIGDPEVATIAAVHEFGSTTRNIPARPFMRTALETGRESIAREHARILGRLMKGKITAKQAAESLGEFIRATIVKRIDTAIQWATPLQPETVAAKGHERPLVDTGTMRDSLRVEVRL